MLSLLRKQISVTNLTVVAALIFAMGGGALAATGGKPKAKGSKHNTIHRHGYVVTSLKQIKPTVLKDLVGKVGPVGPEGKQGQEGKAGANGVNGKDGTNGSNGNDGESVTIAALGPGHGGCAAGGEEFIVGSAKGTACNGSTGNPGESVKVEALTKGDANCKEGGAKIYNASEQAFACNGEAGVSGGGAGGDLAAGETESGTWGIGMSVPLGPNYYGFGNTVFQRPLTAAPEFEVIRHNASATANCKGTVATPEAASGYLCLYVQEEVNVESITSSYRYAFGGIVALQGKAAGAAYGTWAVTG